MRQTLSELYQAIFETPATSSRLDQAEERLDELEGDLTALLAEWAEQENSVQSIKRQETLEDVDRQVETEIFDEDGELNPDLTEDEINDFLDQGVYFGRVMESMYENTLGRPAQFTDPDGDPLIVRDENNDPVDANGDPILNTAGAEITANDIAIGGISVNDQGEFTFEASDSYDGPETGGNIDLQDDTAPVLIEGIQDLVPSDTYIANLDPENLTPNEQVYFSGGIDVWGFQYWVNELIEDSDALAQIAPRFISGAREFQSDNEDLIELNQEGLGFFQTPEADEPVDLSTGAPVGADEINDAQGVRNRDYSDAEDDVAVIVHESAGTWSVAGSQVEDVRTEVWIPWGNMLMEEQADSYPYDTMRPELANVDALYLRNTTEVDLAAAPDLGELWFYSTDEDGLTEPGAPAVTEIEASNVNTGSTLGLYDVDVDVTVNLTTARSYNLIVQGFDNGDEDEPLELALNDLSSRVVGTRLDIDSQAGNAGDSNSFRLESDHLNRINITGEADTTLELDEEIDLTQVNGGLSFGDLTVDLSETGLAEGPTLFHGVLIGSMGDSHFIMDDSGSAEGHLWKEYSRPGNTFTFDGTDGTNTLTVSAGGLDGFDPGAVWNSPNLDRTFNVDNLQILEVDGGDGGGTRLQDDDENPQTVAEAIAADDEVNSLAEFYAADNRLLDTGLFGPDLEEVRITDAQSVHVVTRNTLEQIRLEGTNEVDVEAGSALETITLRDAQDSNILTGGSGVQEINVQRDSDDVRIIADGESLEQINLSGTNDVRIEEISTVEVDTEDDEGNTVTEEVNQVIRLHSVFSNDNTQLTAADGVDSLSMLVQFGHGDVAVNGEDLDTLDISTTSSTIGASISVLDISGMNDDVNIDFSSNGANLWTRVAPGEDTNSITISGVEDAWQEVRLDARELGGLINGDGVEIGENAHLFLEGGDDDSLARNLEITGPGTLRLDDGEYEVFHATPGAFEVGRNSSETTVQSINTDAPVRVVGDMDELELGYARTFSGDTARVELAGGGEAGISVGDLHFIDGHIRDLEINLSATAQDEDGNSTEAHYIEDLDTEYLNDEDENAHNTNSIQFTGEGDVYAGLGVTRIDTDETHDRLAGLADDGTISSGDGEFHAVVRNFSGEDHTLDMGQFADTPDSLGFQGNSRVILEDWDGATGPLHFYQDLSSTVEVQPDVNALTVDVLGGNGTLELASDLSDGLTLVATPGAANLPDALRDDSNTRNMAEADVGETETVNVRNETIGQNFGVATLSGLAHTGTLNISSTDENGWAWAGNLGFEQTDEDLDFTIVNEGGINNQVDGIEADIDADASVEINNQADGAFYITETGLGANRTENIDLSDANQNASLTLNGGNIRGWTEVAGPPPSFASGFDFNAGGATETVSLTVNDDNNWMGLVTAGAATESVTVSVDGDDNELGNIDAESADDVEMTISGDENVTGTLSAENATTIAVAVTGDSNSIGELDLEGSDADEITVTVTGDENAFADTAPTPNILDILAGDATGTVTLSMDGANNTAGDFDADSAEVVEISLSGSGNTVGDVTATSVADALQINLNGSGHSVGELDLATESALHIESNDGGAGSNTVGGMVGGTLEDLTVSGDTTLQIGDSDNSMAIANDGVVDLAAMTGNLELWLDVGGFEGVTVDVFGDDTGDADRLFDLYGDAGTNDLTFDFSDMAVNQQATIVDSTDVGFNWDQLLFEFDGSPLTGDNFRVNGFGEDDAADWDEVFELAGKAGDDTRIHRENGDFELLLVGLSAEELDATNFDVIT